MTAPELKSIAETAEILRVSERQVARLIADGSLVSVKIGRRRVVDVEAIRDYLSSL